MQAYCERTGLAGAFEPSIAHLTRAPRTRGFSWPEPAWPDRETRRVRPTSVIHATVGPGRRGGGYRARMDWSEVEPVLNATYALLDQGDTTQDAVCEALGKPAGDEPTIRALAELYKAGYIEGDAFLQNPASIFLRATEKGLQAVRGWPGAVSEAQRVESLLRALDERIESDETPEEEKGKLRRARDALAGVSRDVLVSLGSAYLAQVTGASGGG